MRRRTLQFGPAPTRLARNLWLFGCVLALLMPGAPVPAEARDILRGGAATANSRRNAEARANAGAAVATQRHQTAQDRLAHTTRAIQAVRNMQSAARAAAIAGPNHLGLNPNNPSEFLPVVPDGLGPGGLDFLRVERGANNPVQSGNTVNIKQTAQQALLEWRTFNVGKNTSVNFDQSAGGADAGKWIAYNRVMDPSGRPSQILGSIRAQGQVYVINQNGIIFGGSSQVNARTLVATSLPVNENLIARGLLNQELASAEFLLSQLPTGGFVPPPVATPSGVPGDVIVQPGARINATVSGEGSGGRVVLAGTNVTNAGTISTPGGQTILAAGQQVGFDAHPASDPSLRGLDVYIGEVGEGGRVTNTGLIDIPTGNLTMAGRQIEQDGAVDSRTTVTLNGRIDLLANYAAVPNAAYDPAVTGGAPPFLHRETGSVTLGPRSVMRILPDTTSGKTTVGNRLPLESIINLRGHTITHGSGSVILAPSARFSAQAGVWRPLREQLVDGEIQYTRVEERYSFTSGRVVFASGALVDVSGSTEVFVPLSQSILDVQLRGNELSVAPLQRDGALRGVPLTVDILRRGVFMGREWVGTPLGDATGFLNILERNAPQLSAGGGSIEITAGQSVVAQPGSILDVSGGYYRQEGGRVQTSRLLLRGNVIDVADATPDRIYDGLYFGLGTKVHEKWGVFKTYAHPLAPMGAHNRRGYLVGADGGSLRITAPAMTLGGEMLGATITGPRQLRAGPLISELPIFSGLTLAFKSELELPGQLFFPVSPTPPEVIFGGPPLAGGSPVAPGGKLVLPADFFQRTGFGALAIENSEGDFAVPAGARISLPAGGSLAVTGRNIDILGSIRAPGGNLAFTAYNFSPYQAEILLQDPLNPAPVTNPAFGKITVGSAASLDTSGLLVDDRPTARSTAPLPMVLGGGSIRLTGYHLDLAPGARLDVSGGLGVPYGGRSYRYGPGGAIVLESGQDPFLPSILGGSLRLGATLAGYSGRAGGSLSIKAPLVQIGGSPLHPDSLVLDPDFFNQGGFTEFHLAGIGALPRGGAGSGIPSEFIPAVWIAPGTRIAPVAESRAYVPHLPGGQGAGLRPIIRPPGLRTPVSLSFSSGSTRRDFAAPGIGAVRGDLLLRGDVVLAAGASIVTEPGGSVALRGDTATVLGSIFAPGGSIEIVGAGSFPLRNQAELDSATFARATVLIGPGAVLSAAGAAVPLPDPFGRRLAAVYPGGEIRIAGNIVAAPGAVLDVSGTSAVLDLHPSRLGLASETRVPLAAALRGMPQSLRTVPVQVESDAGTIRLEGGQMLFSDATLLGQAGGPTALGGMLAVSSGRFYQSGAARTAADINLLVTQGGSAIPRGNRNLGIGLPVLDESGATLPGMGYFAVERFNAGGFDSLDLGFVYNASASPIPFGGNVEFSGNVSIAARGSLRVAAGGVIRADGRVNLSAPYIAVGQAFPAPLNPEDPFIPFREFNPVSGTTPQYFVPPAPGDGELRLAASLIDIGTLALQGVGSAIFDAGRGDIRGSGTLSMAGEITLRAAQIYPPTLANFQIFAYDSPSGPGMVTIQGTGPTALPLSAGGSLGIYATRILQGGTLRAPFGSIVLGWDGTDLDPGDAAVTGPFDPVAGNRATVPTTQEVSLLSGSITSVSGWDPVRQTGILVPFGLSPDGLAWIDPRGVNVTVSGLPEKSIRIAAESVEAAKGSLVDLRGGGDLIAYRWIPGSGGPVDLLGEATAPWSGSAAYEAGSLVRYRGKTWSARTQIRPGDFPGGPTPAPTAGRFWIEVEESFAVLPGYRLPYAPFGAFNTGTRAGLLGGDPGLVSRALRVGDQVYLDGSSSLAAGSYTLLPRRYAVLPGAFVVTPKAGLPFGRYVAPEGANFTTGFRHGALHQPQGGFSGLRQVFEVAPPAVHAARAEYAVYGANEFARAAALRLDISTPQRLPADAGYLAFHGNSGLHLSGSVLSAAAPGGRGAAVDVSSFQPIYVLGNGQAAPDGAVALGARTLSGFGAESLLIGGLRRAGDRDRFEVDIRTSELVVDNAGTQLVAPDILLLSRERLSFAPGAQIFATGGNRRAGTPVFLQGSGAAARFSSRSGEWIERSGVTAATAPLLTVGARAEFRARGIHLDSTSRFDLGPLVDFAAAEISLGAGQISLVLNGAGSLTGSLISPHLVLPASVLGDLEAARSLRLIAHQNTIDIYGHGRFGSSLMETMSLSAGALRGFSDAAGDALLTARNIVLGNSAGAMAPAIPGSQAGSLLLRAEQVSATAGDLVLQNFGLVQMDARDGLLFAGTGSLLATGDLIATAPILTAERGAAHRLAADGMLSIFDSGTVAALEPGLGAELTLLGGTGLQMDSLVVLPSGVLDLRAQTGGLNIGGRALVEGSEQMFYDQARQTNGGIIRLFAGDGGVFLSEGSELSVSANPNGGNAGRVEVSAANGEFVSLGLIEGFAGEAGSGGEFELDAAAVADFDLVNLELNEGGFDAARVFRVRTGDVELSETVRVGDFQLSADTGSITIRGVIDASGVTGGRIALAANRSLTLAAGSLLSVAGANFNNAGQGGSILLEAGTQRDGNIDAAALLELMPGAVLDLGVASQVPGGFDQPGSSAFFGQFAGKLHLRAPRTGNDLALGSFGADILGASAVLIEGFQVYDRTGNPSLSPALRDSLHADNTAYIGAAETGVISRLLSGRADAAALGQVLVLAPGVEIINRSGDLALGNPGALNTSDWDLSSFRYGSRSAPGVLTLRASGDLIFNNTLSDGFTPVAATAENGHSTMWLAPLQTINPELPTNLQSWSYRLAAGADLGAAHSGSVLQPEQLAPGKGSVLVGEFYAAIPNALATGTAAGVGQLGTTANTIRISTTATNTGTRYEVIRTGTGDIAVSAGLDVQLRNQFATIYTAGVALPDPGRIFAAGDFLPPIVNRTAVTHPAQGLLGAIQQRSDPSWAMAGGSLGIRAVRNIGRFTMHGGQLVPDTSRQIPNHYVYRRGYVDPATGRFGIGGVDGSAFTQINDPAASTTWWVDHTNFFQGFGALAGGNISLVAGRDLVNADASIATNARMPGRDPASGLNLRPDPLRLVELGGGDLRVRAGGNIDGGSYYVERGVGEIDAGREITTNRAKTLSRGILAGSVADVADPAVWQPLTLYGGRTQFRVAAKGDILMGPVANAFLMPQGLNNKFWYKTQFHTVGPDAGAEISSYGGSITHRLAVTFFGETNPTPMLQAVARQYGINAISAGFSQPWLRLAEIGVDSFGTVFSVGLPSLRSTAFAGDVNVVGRLNLFPSPRGGLELFAAGGLVGLQRSGLTRTLVDGSLISVAAWTSAMLNLSDANPASIPGIGSPLAFQAVVGRGVQALRDSPVDPLATVSPAFRETGSFSGVNANIERKRALHSSPPLHAGNPDPLRIYAVGGDITGLTLFSPKSARIYAERDITDIAFYLQHLAEMDISIVAAGRDIVPFNQNTPLRTAASNPRRSLVVDPASATVAGTSTRALAGDIQISGLGTLEVLAGRNVDLGTGANFVDGTGTGITSIGNARNPFLPFAGADLVVMAGVGAPGGGPAIGLAGSTLNLAEVADGGGRPDMTPEHQSLAALGRFFELLRQAAEESAETGSYETGIQAVAAVLGNAGSGEIFTRARDVRTSTGGSITMVASGGGLTMASDIFGNPLTPPGIVTEFGGAVDIYTQQSVEIGQARIFTLRGGDLTIWSSKGDIAAGTSPKTVVTAPPTRVLIDPTSAEVVTDLGGLATGGGIGVLASVEGVEPGNVYLIAPEGTVDAGDAGIQATGNLTIAAVAVVNADNISAGGSSAGVPSAPAVAAPNIGGLTAASTTTGATSTAAGEVAREGPVVAEAEEEAPSIITVEVLGYGGGTGTVEDEDG